jgi:hypothetical protein
MKQIKSMIAIVLLLLVGSVSAFGQSDKKETKDKDTEVRQVVQTYLHGLKFNDVASFKKAFWPDAKLFFVKKDGQLGQLTQAQWYEGFVKSAGQEEKGELQITDVDVTDNAASVKVKEDYPDSVYIDYLSLLKINGEWKIVNKIYTSFRKVRKD